MAFILKFKIGEKERGKIKENMEEGKKFAAKQYSRFKKVVLLGEYKNGVKLAEANAG